MSRPETIDVTPVSFTHRRGFTGGLVLIVLGIVFLAESLGLPVPQNWWALFLLIPVAPSLWTAYQQIRAGNSLGAWQEHRASFVVALVAVLFLVGADFGRIWPLFLILAGVSLLLPRRRA
jgi:hypothetical protein